MRIDARGRTGWHPARRCCPANGLHPALGRRLLATFPPDAAPLQGSGGLGRGNVSRFVQRRTAVSCDAGQEAVPVTAADARVALVPLEGSPAVRDGWSVLSGDRAGVPRA